jgi:hypothetical protein
MDLRRAQTARKEAPSNASERAEALRRALARPIPEPSAAARRAGETLEFVIEGIPVSGNNRGPNGDRWRARVTASVAAALPDGFRPFEGEAAAVIVYFHEGPCALDTDNIAKHTLDGLSGLVYADDRILSQVILRRTDQGPGLDLEDPPPLVAEWLGRAPDFVYVRIDPPPPHERMP